MRFWDASAIVPLLITQPATSRSVRSMEEDGEITTWWGTVLECQSALARLEREGVAQQEIQAGHHVLDGLAATWIEVPASSVVRQVAGRLLRTHPLRTGDALQLAAAITASDGNPRGLAFVTFDDRLALAASKEGFPIVTLT